MHYKVQRGDSLEGIAGRFDVTVSQLKKWNNIRGASVPRGSRLRIYASGPPDDAAPHAKPKSAQSGGAAVENVASQSSGTVSYTHLDVYKRQLLACALALCVLGPSPFLYWPFWPTVRAGHPTPKHGPVGRR